MVTYKIKIQHLKIQLLPIMFQLFQNL